MENWKKKFQIPLTGNRKFILSVFTKNINYLKNLQTWFEEALTFRKSDQSFLRIELSDKNGVNQKVLRPFNAPMPAKIVIRNDGYKKFQNITVHNQVGFQIASQFWQAKVICTLIIDQSIYSYQKALFTKRIQRSPKKHILSWIFTNCFFCHLVLFSLASWNTKWRLV